jgi:hypothetical protein
MLTPMDAPFYGIVLGTAALPMGQITLPVTFGTAENYRTEYIKFEVADFETSYHTIFGRPALANFTAVPHYVYLILKMPSPKGVLSLKGDLKRSFDCDKEAIELPAQMCEVLALSKKKEKEEPIFPEKNLGPMKMKPSQGVEIKAIDLGTGDSSKIVLIGSGLPPQ